MNKMKSDKDFEIGDFAIYEGVKLKKLGTEYYMTNPPRYLGTHWVDENNIKHYIRNTMMEEI